MAAAPTASTAPVARLRGGSLRGLNSWNATLGALHLAQGVLMLALATSFSLPVTSSFLELDGASQTLVPVRDTLFELRIAPLVAAFLFLSAAAHWSLASFARGWYRRELARGMNRARWLEYSLSSSLMIVVIALLVGIYDVATLLLLATANAAMILFGWLMEVHNRRTARTDWTAYWFGVLAGAAPWVAIGMQYRRVGRWRDYIYGERVYMLLSLTAKSALAWQVFAGTLRPV